MHYAYFTYLLFLHRTRSPGATDVFSGCIQLNQLATQHARAEPMAVNTLSGRLSQSIDELDKPDTTDSGA